MTRDELEKAAKGYEESLKFHGLDDIVGFTIDKINATLCEAEQLTAAHGCEEFGYCGCNGKIARKIGKLKIQP